MPSRLVKTIQIIKFVARIELLCTMIILLSLGLLIESLFGGGSIQIIIFLSCICVVCGTTIAVSSTKIRNLSKSAETYVIPLNNVSLHSIGQSFGATEISDEAYIAFQTIAGISCRILIQYITQFNSSSLSQQRKKINRCINVKYQVKSEAPIFETLSRLRINLIVCETSSPSLVRYISQNASKLLYRNESIVQAAIILDEQVMLFPDCISTLSLNQVKRYEIAARCVCNAIVAQ